MLDQLYYTTVCTMKRQKKQKISQFLLEKKNTHTHFVDKNMCKRKEVVSKYIILGKTNGTI